MMFSLFLTILLIFFPRVISPSINFSLGENFWKEEAAEPIVEQSKGDSSGIANLPRAEPYAPQKKSDSKSIGIETTAKSTLVFDAFSGAVLFAENTTEKLPLASITKLATALVFLDNNPGWGKKIKLRRADDRDGGIVYARSPEEVTVKDLFSMTLVGSVNNAAVALARSTGLSKEDFVNKMNEKARDLKMSNTLFVDQTGLEPSNQGTAVDMAKLLSAALEKEEIKEAVLQKKYIFSPIGSKKIYYVKSTNELLWSFLNEEPYKIGGGKTGYIEESGYNLAVEIERAGHKIIVVVLGSQTIEDRFKEAKGLADWTFENYDW